MSGDEGAIRLTVQERRGLYQVAHSVHIPARVALRATVILMSAEGSGARTIGRVLGMGLRTVRLTRRRWRREGYEGLHDQPRSGRRRRANNRYVALMRRVVQTDPRQLGFCFAHWTAPRLAEYLKQRTGVSLCEDHVRRLLRGLGFVWRKTKLTIRNLQNSREKKGGSKAALGASDSRFATRSEFRVVVRGRGALRSFTGDDLCVSASRQAAAHRNTRQESTSGRVRSLPLP